MLTVRPATVGDADAIGAIHVLAWRAAYSGLLPDAFLRSLSIPDWQYRRRAQLEEANRAAHVDVALRNGQVVGFATYGPSRDDDAHRGTGELYAIYLHPEHWRAGNGTRLHAATLETLRGNGFGDATLWVLAGNVGAQAFYTALGWSPDGARQHSAVGQSPPAEQVRYRRAL